MKYKKIEQELNKIIENSNNVSDSVLDRARMELQNNKVLAEKQVKQRMKKSNLIFACLTPVIAVLVLLLILIPTATHGKKVDPILKGNDVTYYDYLSLKREKTISIEAYNKKYHQNILWPKEAERTESFSYCLDLKTIVLEEQYHYQDISFIMYVSSIMGLANFKEFNFLTNKLYITKEQYINYEIKESYILAKTSINQYTYYFEIQATELSKALEIITLC